MDNQIYILKFKIKIKWIRMRFEICMECILNEMSLNEIDLSTFLFLTKQIATFNTIFTT